MRRLQQPRPASGARFGRKWTDEKHARGVGTLRATVEPEFLRLFELALRAAPQVTLPGTGALVINGNPGMPIAFGTLGDLASVDSPVPVANGGTASTDVQTAINTLMGSAEGDVGKIPAVDSDGNVILTGGLPGTPVVAKTIDANNIVRFTVTQDVQDQTNEEYRFDLYDPTNTTLEHTRTLTSLYTGSDRLRDKWIEFTTSEQTAAGYTPGPTETFWIDVVQIGDDGNSDSNKQEL